MAIYQTVHYFDIWLLPWGQSKSTNNLSKFMIGLFCGIMCVFREYEG